MLRPTQRDAGGPRRLLEGASRGVLRRGPTDQRVALETLYGWRGDGPTR